MDKIEQLTTYGQPLTGTETDLERARLGRTQYLKTKLRYYLDLLPFGDTKDNLTDLTKGAILGWAIQQGIVTDEAILARFKAAVAAQLEFYGGAEFIMGMLEDNAAKLADLMARYYQAKADIAAAEDSEVVMKIDIEDVPESSGPL